MKKIEFLIYRRNAHFWFLNGVKHREDGPAIISPDGHQSWYIKGRFIKEEKPNEKD